jgi:hypothetical protein
VIAQVVAAGRITYAPRGRSGLEAFDQAAAQRWAKTAGSSQKQVVTDWPLSYSGSSTDGLANGPLTLNTAKRMTAQIIELDARASDEIADRL